MPEHSVIILVESKVGISASFFSVPEESHVVPGPVDVLIPHLIK